jgi:hypothetical protein
MRSELKNREQTSCGLKRACFLVLTASRHELEVAMKALIKRMIGASRLDATTYEQVEADRRSTTGAILVVIISSVAAAIGSGSRDLVSVISAVILLLAAWMIWVGLTYFIGARLLPGPETHADIGEVLRTTGFSASPGILRIFGLIPAVGFPIFIVVTVWMLLTFVVAIRQALDYASSIRALAVCLLGWLIHGLLFFGFVLVAI